jgi:hypothetical protein
MINLVNFFTRPSEIAGLTPRQVSDLVAIKGFSQRGRVTIAVVISDRVA